MSELDDLKMKLKKLDEFLSSRMRHLDEKTRNGLKEFLDDSRHFWQDVADDAENILKVGGSKARKVEHNYPGEKRER